MAEVPHFGGRALEKLELRGASAGLVFDDAGANAPQCAPGTIPRRACAVDFDSLVHGTDSPESAEREVPAWFADVELV